MPNMALGEMSDLRPHLVLESHCAKTFLEASERRKLGFQEEMLLV